MAISVLDGVMPFVNTWCGGVGITWCGGVGITWCVWSSEYLFMTSTLRCEESL